MAHCALCTDGCKYCQPNIPVEYADKFAPGQRNHYQMESVIDGLHPSGNELYKLKSGVPKCKDCKFYSQHPTVPKSYGLCGLAIDKEHRKISGRYDACELFKKELK